jgi:L-fuconolactonase
MAERVDAHHQFWRYRSQSCGWLDGRMSVLRRDYLPEEFEQKLRSTGVAGAVAAQAGQTLAETDWFLSQAAACRWVWAAVAWAPFTSAKFPSVLERLRTREKLRGLRHAIHEEPDDRCLQGRDFNRGIAAMKGLGLICEIGIHERQLPAAIEFVDHHPDQVFVLDHLAKPRIRERVLDPWQSHLAELARRENVYCKVSGMVTEADWSDWTAEDLRPYFDVVLDVFGPRRLLAGSDWPMCLLATSYSHWWQTLKDFIRELSVTEQDCILGTNAIRLYQLQDSLETREGISRDKCGGRNELSFAGLRV